MAQLSETKQEKQIYVSVLFFAFLMFYPLCTWAFEFTEGGIRYREISREGKVALEVIALANGKYKGDIVIPEKLDGDPVVSIGKKAFYGCYSLTSVRIPSSVTNIGESAFFYCSSLVSVTIPNTVAIIGNNSFQYCTSLACITIPKSTKYIGNYAFEYCSKLTAILNYATTPPAVCEHAFYGIPKTAVLYVPDESIKIYKRVDWGQGCISQILPLSEYDATRK